MRVTYLYHAAVFHMEAAVGVYRQVCVVVFPKNLFSLDFWSPSYFFSYFLFFILVVGALTGFESQPVV